MAMNGKDFIGTKFEPFYQNELRNEARRARAYFAQVPYPVFGFRDWKTEEGGPLPLCLSYPRDITQKSADWLFGKPLGFSVNGNKTAGDKAAAKRLEAIWSNNRMHTRIRAAAVSAGQSGGYFLKFSYDKSQDEAVAIDIYDAPDYVRIYTDPMDPELILMVRLEWPVYDAIKGQWSMHREEWTNERHVVYKPLLVSSAPSENLNITQAMQRFSNDPNYTASSWVVEDDKANAFGVIPGQLVKNLDIGCVYGWGDLWSFWPLVDRINLTSNLMHVGNQLAAFPREIRINLTTAPDEDDTPLSPQEPEYLQPANKELPFDIKQFDSSPAAREHLQTYLEMLRHLLYETAGSVYLDPETVTGKGQLSSQVMRLIFGPLIRTTNAKRQCQGEAGIAPFLSKLMYGLSKVSPADPAAMADADVTVHFADYFEATEDEKLARVSRISAEVNAGLKPLDFAVRENATADGLLDVDELLAAVQEFEDEQDDLDDAEPGEAKNEPEVTNNETT